MEGLAVRVTSSLRNKIVMMSGASGFIGSHLTRRLLEEGAEIHLLLREDTDLFRIQDIIEKINVWHCDIRDYQTVRTCIKKAKPKIIFHLATLRNVNREIALIEPMVDTNIKGTMNLLNAVTDELVDLECFINTGTCEEYGDGPAPFREEQREIPVSPYSASKVAATYLCQMIQKSLGLPIITLRPFLTYGPYQEENMFIPSLISHCLDGKDFPMTEGDQTREFNYVEDIVDAYISAALSKEAIGEIINIGNGIEYSIRDVAKKTVDMMGNPVRLLIGAIPKRPGETKHFFCSNEKARRLLGWTPRVGLEEGLKKTIDWYRNYLMKHHEHIQPSRH